MSWEDVNIETPIYAHSYQAKTDEVNRNLLEDLQKEQSRLSNDFPICSLLIDDALDRFYSIGLVPGSDTYADMLNRRQMKLVQKVFMPLNKCPRLNVTEKLLGANGNSLIHLQATTQCKILIKGRNSMIDKTKEEELRQSEDPRFRHLNKDLYLEISTVATPVECFTRIAYALGEIRKFLLLNDEDDDSRKELSDIIKVEQEVTKNLENVKYEIMEINPIIDDPPLQVEVPIPILTKPQAEKNNNPFIVSLADKLIKLLDETVLNPNFQYSEEETVLVSNHIDTLSSFMISKIPLKSSVPILSSKCLENMCTTKSSTSKVRTHSASKKINLSKKRIAKRKVTRDLTNTNNIEYKIKKKKSTQDTLARNLFQKKDRFPGIFYIKDKKINKIVKRQIANRTALNRCLKRSNKETIETEDEEAEYKPYSIEYLQQTPTELVFEYTPRDIIISLLETIKNYPVLWEFHDKSFNEDYTEAIEDVCQIINVKWSLNTDCLQMRRSINRVIRFYRFLYPFENIEKFSEYFDKCALFLPSTVMTLPHARCPHCFICYTEDVELRRHLIEEHSKSLKWPHKCPYCAEIFKDNDEYELHKRLPHFMEIFTCEQCNERFSVRYKYNYHIAKHQRNLTGDPRNHICDECGKAFRTSGELRSHKYYHEEKKFKCHLCPKAYFKSPSLLLHLKRHRNQLDIICEVCGKGFLHHRYLNDHMETHSGAQISCNICNLKLRRSNLLRHLRTIHVAVEGTIESTFRAKGHRYNQHNHAVRRTFNPKYGRTKRSKRSEEKCPRQYACKSCNINFDRLKFLKDHNKEYHANLNRVPCKMCDSQLAQKQNLRRHYREKHKLHDYQAFVLVEKDDDINTVLAMTPEDLEKMNEQSILK